MKAADMVYSVIGIQTFYCERCRLIDLLPHCLLIEIQQSWRSKGQTRLRQRELKGREMRMRGYKQEIEKLYFIEYLMFHYQLPL
jgi:hypothetical protein